MNANEYTLPSNLCRDINFHLWSRKAEPRETGASEGGRRRKGKAENNQVNVATERTNQPDEVKPAIESEQANKSNLTWINMAAMKRQSKKMIEKRHRIDLEPKLGSLS